VIENYMQTYQLFKSDLMIAFWETLDMISTSMLISLFIGLILGFLLFVTRPDGIHKHKVLYFMVSGIVNITRSIPFILFIIVMIPFNRMILGTGFGVDASKIPLSFIGVATFARFVERDLLDVNKSIYETSYALGADSFQYLTRFLLVEARSGLVLSFTSTVISLLSYSTVMGIIGGGGLGYLAISEGYYNFNYPLMWIIIGVMVMLVFMVQGTGNYIAKKIDKR
jgi:D-methionine transport system permease protein